MMQKLLDNNANTYKGGRDYIHGTDIVPYLETHAQTLAKNCTLNQIEFHKPLRSQGILVIHENLVTPNKKLVNASGYFKAPDTDKFPFVIFSTPFPVDPEMREFNEKTIWSKCTVNTHTKSVDMITDTQFSFMEYISSMMKLLCQTLAPTYESWWFVQMKKTKDLPVTFKNLTILTNRITANKYYSAHIIVDDSLIGSIDFIGN